MSTYQNDMKELQSLRCPVCHGTGKCNDAESGDIGFDEWDCPSCKGSGYRTDALARPLFHAIGGPYPDELG